MHSRKKKTPLVPSKRSGYLQLTSAAHQSRSTHLHLHLFRPLLPTGRSLFGGGRGKEKAKGKWQNCSLLTEGEEGLRCSECCVMAGERGEEQCFPSGEECREKAADFSGGGDGD